ncbi:MAG: glycoside hydrolase family 9 protein [Lachnospiraceae bacterium]|nr:glycoside hydrolase family 9 protein [Lachnospiraceae bacterium]
MISVNQVAYESSAVKHATLRGATHYILHDAKDSIVLEGDAKPVSDENSGIDAACIDFSSVTEAGEYYFTDDSGDKSPRFSISETPYKNLFRDAIRMLYFQRCGMALEEKYAGKFAHAACHCGKARILGTERFIELGGGWHDAGDYGRYVTAGAVAVAHLLYAYLGKPEAFELSLDIPESGNGIPDILNECRWELDWMLKMQEEDGSVHHKATSMHFADFIMPEEDDLEVVVTPVSSLAAADFAAIMSLASRCFEKYDAALAESYKAAALKAGEWLQANPAFLFENPKDVHTGTYEDMFDADERLWAAAELFILSGDRKWIFEMRRILELRVSLTALGWADVGGLASLAVFGARESFPEDLVNKLKGTWLEEADRLRSVAEGNPYELAFHPYDFRWGSNMQVLCNAMELLVAYELSGKESYRDTARFQLDYLLGRNAMDVSYVTGHGERAFRDPHNRPTVADGIDEPIPGYVSGGPNYRPGDTAANKETLAGRGAMCCYVDDWRSYSTNEITIYWNSPLVFVLAYLLDSSK